MTQQERDILLVTNKLMGGDTRVVIYRPGDTANTIKSFKVVLSRTSNGWAHLWIRCDLTYYNNPEKYFTGCEVVFRSGTYRVTEVGFHLGVNEVIT